MNRVRLWRRRWCMWRGHPRAAWAPTVIRYREPDWVRPDGAVVAGDTFEQIAYRCMYHDRRPS